MAQQVRQADHQPAHQTGRGQVPRLRGALHAVALPVAAVAGAVLIGTAPTPLARLAAGIYVATSLLLFGVSAAYHRARLPPRARAVLHRCDHANIYLIIAGTYTPIALLTLHGNVRAALLTVVWAGAAAGVVFRVAWLSAPRWLYTSLYLGLGWAALAVLPSWPAAREPRRWASCWRAASCTAWAGWSMPCAVPTPARAGSASTRCSTPAPSSPTRPSSPRSRWSSSGRAAADRTGRGGAAGQGGRGAAGQGPGPPPAGCSTAEASRRGPPPHSQTDSRPFPGADTSRGSSPGRMGR